MNRTPEEEYRALRGLCVRCGVLLSRRNRAETIEGPPLCKDCGIVIEDAEYARLGGVL